MPHPVCPVWTWWLLDGFIIANLLIAISYFVIPFLLLQTRIRIRSALLIGSFALFIFSCGVTHVMQIVTIWKPWFWLSTGIDLFTAVVSLSTAVLLQANGQRLIELPQSIIKEQVTEIRDRVAALSQSLYDN